MFDLGTLGTLRSGELAVLVIAVAVAIASAWRLYRIGIGEDRQFRLGTMVAAVLPRRADDAVERGSWLQRLGALLAASPLVGRKAQQKHLESLNGAGIRGPAALTILLGLKVVSFVLFTALAWGLATGTPAIAGNLLLRIGVMLLGIFGGWEFPDFVVTRIASHRRDKIERGMPDALDLLVICAEAGLSLTQAIEEVAKDLHRLSPEIAEEFSITVSEMRVLTDRSAALDNLAQRTGIEHLRGLIATLTQSIKFGTPLAESLRMFANEMRLMRLAKMEERAARLPVLLAIPLILFIMPALLMVIATPIALRIIDRVLAVFPFLAS